MHSRELTNNVQLLKSIKHGKSRKQVEKHDQTRTTSNKKQNLEKGKVEVF